MSPGRYDECTAFHGFAPCGGGQPPARVIGCRGLCCWSSCSPQPKGGGLLADIAALRHVERRIGSCPAEREDVLHPLAQRGHVLHRKGGRFLLMLRHFAQPPFQIERRRHDRHEQIRSLPADASRLQRKAPTHRPGRASALAPGRHGSGLDGFLVIGSRLQRRHRQSARQGLKIAPIALLPHILGRHLGCFRSRPITALRSSSDSPSWPSLPFMRSAART